jgi:hypothetical protein
MPPDFTQELPGMQSVSNWQERAGVVRVRKNESVRMVFMGDLLFYCWGT